MSFVSRLSLATAAVASLVIFGPQVVAGQDYVQFETQYLISLPGQSEDLEEALGAHNRRFHNAGAYLANVYRVVNGPRAGQYVWIMGPGTWTAWDERPADDAHDSDWANNVLGNARNGRVEYWRRVENLSSVVDGGDTSLERPLNRVRFFSVENAGLFRQTQAMQEEASLAVGQGPRSRAFYARQFSDPDGRNFALVQSYRNFGELDAGGGGAGGFQAVLAKMVELHGTAAFTQWQADREAAGITTMDEWQQLLPELSGAGSGN